MFWPISKKTVVIHSGNFHADDVFSVASLLLYLGYMPRIIRSRDEVKIKKADFVMDVGALYDPAKNRFDHHQAGGAGKRENGIPYAAFGLVWKQFGSDICGSKEVSLMIESKLVAFVDADDNAFNLYEKYTSDVRPYTISDYIIYKNSITNESDRDGVFKKLVIWAAEILQMEIKIAKTLIEDYKKVEITYLFSENKKIIILDGDYAWEDVIAKYPEPLFVIKPSINIKSWKIYAVRSKENRFTNRVDLPLAWASKRDEDLVKVTGVSDAIYCHHGRYMAIAGSKDGAIKMAELALKEAETNKNK